MLDKLKNKFNSYYNEHPKTTIGAGVLLGITLVVIIAFGANSTLFQGNLASDIVVDNSTIEADKIVAGEADPGLGEKLEVINNGNKPEVLPGAEERLGDLIADKSEVDEDAPANVADFSLAEDALGPDINTDLTQPRVDLGEIGDPVTRTVTGTSENDSEQQADEESEENQQVAEATDRPPVAENVRIETDSFDVGSVLAGEYDYSDTDNDEETSSSYRWLRADDPDALFVTTGVTTRNYETTSEDSGKYLSFEVIPVNANAAGEAIRSIAVGPIAGVVSSPPFGTEVEIIGQPTVGAPLLGIYQFNDPEDDSEGESKLTWYRVLEGIPEPIAEGSDIYEVTEADLGAEIVFGYSPVSTVAETNGEEVFSAPIGPIAAASEDTDSTNEDEVLITTEDSSGDEDILAENTESDTEEPQVDPIVADDPFVDQQQFVDTTSNPAQESFVSEQADTGLPTPTADVNSGFSLTSNTNANLLSSAQVQGDTGPEAVLILPLLGAFGFGMGRKLAKRK